MLSLGSITFILPPGTPTLLSLHAPEVYKSTQTRILSLLREAVLQFVSWPVRVPLSVPELKREMASLSVEYGGNICTKAKSLIASKVIPVWPEPSRAASLDITDFLTGEFLDDVRSPQRVLLPPSQLPPTPKRSKVHASDEELYLLANAGLENGLFRVVRDAEVFRDAARTKVLNGAMGVSKCKETSEGIIEYVRFICIVVL